MTPLDILESEVYYDQLSLYVMQGTTRAALLSCGGVIEAALAVARNELKKTFAIVRPPGHHAEPDEHMGFCFFNNVAVAARVVQQTTSLKRIMILDWYVVLSEFACDESFKREHNHKGMSTTVNSQFSKYSQVLTFNRKWHSESVQRRSHCSLYFHSSLR
jgi:hypothetical protein